MSVNNTQRALLANYLLGQGSSSTQGKNYVKNSIAINGTDNVTASGVGSSVTKNTTTPLTGISDFSVALGNNTTGYIEWSLDSLDSSLTNQNCQLTFDYKITSIGSVVQGQVYIGGVLSVAQTIPATPTTSTFSMNVPCGDLSGSTTVRISNAVGNSGASVLNIANVNYGKATNIGTVQQAIIYGSALYPATTNCQWSTTSTAFTTFAADADCPTPTVTGNASAPSTKIPGITFASLPPGEYEITARGSLRDFTLDTNGCSFGFTDGTNRFGQTQVYAGANMGVLVANLTSRVRYTSPQSNITFQIVSRSDNATNTCGIQASDTTNEGGFEIIVKYFPSSSQQAVSSAQSDYDWTAYTPTFSAGFGTAASIAFFHRRIGSTLEVKGTFTTGTVTTGLGSISLPSGLVMDTTKMGVSATTASPGQKVGTYGQNGSTAIVGNIIASTATSTSLVYISSLSNTTTPMTPTANVNTPMTNTAVTSIEFSVPISGWTSNQRAPTLVGSVTSNASGAERIERAIVDCSTTGSVSSSSSSWLTVGNISANRCAITITSGTFSAKPTCTCSYENAATNALQLCNMNVASATSMSVGMVQQIGATTTAGSGVGVNNFHLVCMGPR